MLVPACQGDCLAGDVGVLAGDGRREHGGGNRVDGIGRGGGRDRDERAGTYLRNQGEGRTTDPVEIPGCG